jgi:hypothetical protein
MQGRAKKKKKYTKKELNCRKQKEKRDGTAKPSRVL